jgi:hypothetical protein
LVPHNLGTLTNIVGTTTLFIAGTTATTGSLSAKAVGSTEYANITILPGTLSQLIKISGDNQVATATYTLAEPLLVKTADEFGNAIAQVGINFEIIETPAGAVGMQVTPTFTYTNESGLASVTVKLGNKAGEYKIKAECIAIPASVTFTASATELCGTITGKVRAIVYYPKETGYLDIPNTEVKIIELATSTYTGPDSRFAIGNILPGTYSLYIDTTGAAYATMSNILVNSGEITDIGEVLLLAADTNDDRYVDGSDFVTFLNAYWSEPVCRIGILKQILINLIK